MNICFVANFYKTYFFHEIAKNLMKEGVSVYWVVVNRGLHDFLLRNYPSDRIIYMGKTHQDLPAEPVGEYKLNELVYGDRVLKYEKNWPFVYLRNIQKPFYEFIKSNKICYVFGEITWAHEILFHRILNDHADLNCKYLCPHTIRIPSGRFAFFCDEYQSEIHEVSVPNESEEEGNLFEVKKPEYLAINDRKVSQSRRVSARLSRIWRYFSRVNIDPNDPTVIANRLISFKVHAAEEVNRELYRLARRREFDGDLQERKYIFIALHKQPEASIDVLGRYYEDQWVNILNVWRTLPSDWYLYVKEHTNAIGDRPLSFYKKICNLPRVVLLHESTDSHAVILNSEAVVTVSGTVAYEAALLGKRSYTFAPCFFNKFSKCSQISMVDFRRKKSFLLDDGSKFDEYDVKEFIIKNSFVGKISDPVSDPSIVEADNLELVSKAFLRVLI